MDEVKGSATPGHKGAGQPQGRLLLGTRFPSPSPSWGCVGKLQSKGLSAILGLAVVAEGSEHS